MTHADKLSRLRTLITESLRIQRGGAEPIAYIDLGSVLGDVSARQNHVIFGRRGCGKTLLLHYSAQKLPRTIRAIYLNCEDFKKHTFPNVLIEILDALLRELHTNLRAWFGKKKRLKKVLEELRAELQGLRIQEDSRNVDVVDRSEAEHDRGATLKAGLKGDNATAAVAFNDNDRFKYATELRYKYNEDKIRRLDDRLPRIKERIREFFSLSGKTEAVFVQIDDFYHLTRTDQPFVADYVHRLCKDLPLFFKIATLRHASTLYADRAGQPVGAQERHDYQPINVDFSIGEFNRTVKQNFQILSAFGEQAGLTEKQIQDLFKGEGFARLVLAGGGVPRDVLSLFLEIHQTVQQGDGKIGKDDVRIQSRSNFDRRIEDLKQDSEGAEQSALIKGIYVLRKFCVVDKKSNVFLVPESTLQTNDRIRGLLYRLMDYRIVHSVATAITHKSLQGTFHAFAIDIGCYAHMRILDKKLSEIDLAATDAKERLRSAPVLEEAAFNELWGAALADPSAALREQDGG